MKAFLPLFLRIFKAKCNNTNNHTIIKENITEQFFLYISNCITSLDGVCTYLGICCDKQESVFKRQQKTVYSLQCIYSL